MTGEIKFRAIVNKVQSITAGGFRVTLDGLSQDIVQAAYLMPIADTPGITVEVNIRVIEENEQTKHTIIKRSSAKQRN